MNYVKKNQMSIIVKWKLICKLCHIIKQAIDMQAVAQEKDASHLHTPPNQLYLHRN